MSSEPDKKSDALRESPRLRKVLGRGFARASLSKLNLIVLGAAATGAALSESWSVLLFAAAGFVVLTAIKLCDGSFWNTILSDVRNEPVPLPDTSTLLESSARTCIERIANARLVMRQVLDDIPRDVRARFADAIARVPDLEQQAIVLSGRIEELSRYLANISYEVLRMQMQSLDSRRKTSHDAQSRERYADAHAVRGQHLAALDEISAAKERSVAALDHVVGLLERLPTHMMMIRAMEAEVADRAMAEGQGDGEGTVGWFEAELHRIEDESRSVLLSDALAIEAVTEHEARMPPS